LSFSQHNIIHCFLFPLKLFLQIIHICCCFAVIFVPNKEIFIKGIFIVIAQLQFEYFLRCFILNFECLVMVANRQHRHFVKHNKIGWFSGLDKFLKIVIFMYVFNPILTSLTHSMNCSINFPMNIFSSPSCPRIAGKRISSIFVLPSSLGVVNHFNAKYCSPVCIFSRQIDWRPEIKLVSSSLYLYNGSRSSNSNLFIFGANISIRRLIGPICGLFSNFRRRPKWILTSLSNGRIASTNRKTWSSINLN